MARQEQDTSRQKRQEAQKARTLRLNQVIFAIISGIIILSMIFSLVSW